MYVTTPYKDTADGVIDSTCKLFTEQHNAETETHKHTKKFQDPWTDSSKRKAGVGSAGSNAML